MRAALLSVNSLLIRNPKSAFRNLFVTRVTRGHGLCNSRARVGEGRPGREEGRGREGPENGRERRGSRLAATLDGLKKKWFGAAPLGIIPQAAEEISQKGLRGTRT